MSSTGTLGRMTAQPVAQLEPAHLRHHDVGDHEVHRLRGASVSVERACSPLCDSITA